jgi:hypothetical protein
VRNFHAEPQSRLHLLWEPDQLSDMTTAAMPKKHAIPITIIHS